MPIQFQSQVSSTPVNTPEQIVEQANQSVSRLYDISAKPEFSQRIADDLISLDARSPEAHNSVDLTLAADYARTRLSDTVAQLKPAVTLNADVKTIRVQVRLEDGDTSEILTDKEAPLTFAEFTSGIMDASSDLIEKYSSGEVSFNAFTGLIAVEATKGMFKLIAEVNNMTEEQLNEQPEVAVPSEGQKDVVDLALEHDTSIGSQELQKGLALLRAEAIQKVQPKIMALTMAFMLSAGRG